eukprot:g5485.t1
MPSSEWIEVRARVLAHLNEKKGKEGESILDRLPAPWNDARFFLFGSSASGLGSPNSDADLCLVLPPGHPDYHRQAGLPSKVLEPLVVAVRNALESSAFAKDVSDRRTARIPIVMFKDVFAGDVDCDCCFGNVLALRNTNMLRMYVECDARFQKIAYIVKRWASCRDIKDPGKGTLSSYGYMLMLVHFLQRRSPPVLPVLQQLPLDMSPSSEATTVMMRPGWRLNHEKTRGCLRMETGPSGKRCNTYFYELPSQSQSEEAPISERRRVLRAFSSKNQESVGALLAGFFAYFAFGFDFYASVVTVRVPATDRVTKREKVASLGSWTSVDEERLSIEDPFEIGYDVAHVVKPFGQQRIREEFVRACAIVCGCSMEVCTKDCPEEGAAAEGGEEGRNPPSLLSCLLRKATPVEAVASGGVAVDGEDAK